MRPALNPLATWMSPELALNQACYLSLTQPVLARDLARRAVLASMRSHELHVELAARALLRAL